jgi:hypothetical protein
VERGCIRLRAQPREDGAPGRPPSPIIELHPALARHSVNTVNAVVVL